MTQSQLADALGGDAGWLSRNLRGPGNWTLRTVGRLVDALDGEVEFKVHGLEDPLPAQPNYHAYADYGQEIPATTQRAKVTKSGTFQAALSSGVQPRGLSPNTAILVP
jgi:hypothetical protein